MSRASRMSRRDKAASTSEMKLEIAPSVAPEFLKHDSDQRWESQSELIAEWQRWKRQQAYERYGTQQKMDDALKLKVFLSKQGFKEDVNVRRKCLWKHYYPLHDAVAKHDADMVRILLDARADPSLRSSSGKTALERAMKWNSSGAFDEVVAALAEKEAGSSSGSATSTRAPSDSRRSSKSPSGSAKSMRSSSKSKGSDV